MKCPRGGETAGMFRTLVNISDDAVTAVLVSNSEKNLNVILRTDDMIGNYSFAGFEILRKTRSNS